MELQFFGVWFMAKCLKKNLNLKQIDYARKDQILNIIAYFLFSIGNYSRTYLFLSVNNEFLSQSLTSRFRCMLSITSIFWCSDILVFFSSVLDLSTWNLFSISDALSFLRFPQGLSTPTFEKLEENEKKTQMSMV